MGRRRAGAPSDGKGGRDGLGATRSDAPIPRSHPTPGAGAGEGAGARKWCPSWRPAVWGDPRGREVAGGGLRGAGLDEPSSKMRAARRPGRGAGLLHALLPVLFTALLHALLPALLSAISACPLRLPFCMSSLPALLPSPSAFPFCLPSLPALLHALLPTLSACPPCPLCLPSVPALPPWCRLQEALTRRALPPLVWWAWSRAEHQKGQRDRLGKVLCTFHRALLQMIS